MGDRRLKYRVSGRHALAVPRDMPWRSRVARPGGPAWHARTV